MIMKIAIVLVILILGIPLWCCVVVASDCDDMMERKYDESSKH